MNRDLTAEELERYADGEIEPGEVVEMEQHLLQLLPGDLLFFGVRLLVDEPRIFDDIARAEEQQAFAR